MIDAQKLVGELLEVVYGVRPDTHGRLALAVSPEEFFALTTHCRQKYGQFHAMIGGLPLVVRPASPAVKAA